MKAPVAGSRKSRNIGEVQDGNVVRIRLSQEKEQWGGDFTITTTRHLDGTVIRHVSTQGSTVQEDRAMSKVAITEAKDSARLSRAAQTLASHLVRYTTAEPPSADQLGTLLLGYQNLLDQREEAAKRLAHADGEIQAVARLLSRFVQ